MVAVKKTQEQTKVAASVVKTDAIKKRPTQKLRKSLTPGTVVILLSGRYHGKRAVFLKQLESGSLLVTGPHNLNGVPLRRVNQAFVIATKTKVKFQAKKLPEITDAFFTQAKKDQNKLKFQGKNREERFLNASNKQPLKVSEEVKKTQRAVDGVLSKSLANNKVMKMYLKTKFSLQKDDRPHEMIF